MANQQQVIDCYDKTAADYSEKYGNELAEKHLDKILLRAFAIENSHRGMMIDVGCGPGQTTDFVYSNGCETIVGTDISEGMIRTAKSNYPALTFEQADMLNLRYVDSSLGSAIAFYSIVHFGHNELQQAFKEIQRVLKPGGEFLFSFHIGDDTVHMDNFLGHDVNIDFYFFQTSEMRKRVEEAGFEFVDVMERAPYPQVEYPSQRAYFWMRKI